MEDTPNSETTEAIDALDTNARRGERYDPSLSTDGGLEDLMEEEADRPNALLTKAYRRYLLGIDESTSTQQENKKRGRIRRRVQHGLIDCLLLATELSERDRELIFHPQKSNDNLESHVWVGAVGALRFLYEGLDDFSEALEQAIYYSITEGGGPPVNVSVTVEQTEVETDVEGYIDSTGVVDDLTDEGDDTPHDSKEGDEHAG